jgi:hypothetical protein
LGHEVVLIPPQYIKPYVQRGKNDKIRACPRAGRRPDPGAEAICEAMGRPTMRFVLIKTVEQQAALTILGVRDLLVKQRTMLINAIRGHAAEFGLTAAKGPKQITELLQRLANDEGVRRWCARCRCAGHPTRLVGCQIEGDRETADGLAPAGSDQPMPGDHPRDRADQRRQLCPQSARPQGVSVGSAFYLVGRHHAARGRDRR